MKLQLNTKVTPDLVKQLNPDALVIATGARPIRPKIQGVDGDNVIDAATALSEPDRGWNIVIIGGGEVGCETAIHLSRKGKKVVIVEILDTLLALAEIKNNIVVLEQLLDEENIQSYSRSKVVEITPGSVVIVDSGGKTTTLPADTVVLALGLQPDSTTTEGLKRSCSKLFTRQIE